ncbi:hypothetical protein CHS0354_011536 [Potamilus streckersoni]|uniref:Protein rolling stone n=1 Tax=Potamilus streckersoni TaxID=2493646 RepID=A0AAE0SKW3_9BIVA|nr:hypothetical protein CHS0354_011536 [Potamilus streckersoni]
MAPCETRLILEEFKLRNLWFYHDRKEDFYRAQWRWNPWIFIVYRLLAAFYSTGCLLAVTVTSIGEPGVHNIMVYLTIWTYSLLTLYFVLAAILALFCHLYKETHRNEVSISVLAHSSHIKTGPLDNKSFVVEEDTLNTCSGQADVRNVSKDPTIDSSLSISSSYKLPWYMKLTWFLANVVYVFAIIVTIIYFSAVYPTLGMAGTNINDLNMHAFNTLLVMIDALVVARPVRLLHFVDAVIYGLLYCVFSVIYWSADKTRNVLYKNVLDWNQPGIAIGVMAGLAIVVVPLLQFMHFFIFRLRLYLSERF